AEQRDAQDVEVVVVAGIDADLAEVHGPRVDAVDARPRFAAVGRFVDAAGLEAVGPLLGLDVLLLAAQRRAVGPPRVGSTAARPALTAAAGPAATATARAGRAGGDRQLGLGRRAAAGVANFDLVAGL